jgi:4-hydroxyphenylacetate decarboxylase small subunit
MAQQHDSRHMDCRNFAPLDVVKGLCHLSKEKVIADQPSCEHFDRLPKCRHCAKFADSGEQHLGTCTAEETAAMAYPEMVATTCEWFGWKS